MPERNKKQKSPKKRFLLGVSVGLLLTVSIFFLATPVHQAQALPGEALAAAAWKEIRDQVRNIKNLAKSAWESGKKISGDVAFKNALSIYLTKIAEDTATYIATGDPGQKPLFISDPHYWTNLHDAALGDTLDKLSTQVLGVSMCDIGPVKVKIDLALRAEINPNFCTDGCQKSFEQKLQPYEKYHDELIAYLEVTYEQFYNAEAEWEIAVCEQHDGTDLTTCESEPLSLLGCTWDGGNNVCVAEVDRLMTPGENRGGNAISKLDLSYLQPESENYNPTLYSEFFQAATLGDAYGNIVSARCPLDHRNGDQEFFYLKTCIDSLRSSVTADKESAQYDKDRCVNLCVGVKHTAKCTWTDIKERSQAAYDNSEFLATYPQIFNPTQNEVGQYLFAYETAREEADTAKEEAQDSREFDEIGPIKSIISGSITTPSTLTKKAAEKPLEDAGKDVATYTGSPIADAIGVFTNTLTKKLIEQIFNRSEGGFVNPETPSLFGGGYNSGGTAAARAQFAKSFTPNVTRQSNQQFDTLAELQADNIIDSDLVEAARQELTVEEAIEKNLLHSDWYFGYGQNRKPAEVGNGGYNAQTFPILRTHRIIPVGWEIAARYNNEYENKSLTLGTMIERYDDENSPYFRLVDPKWVLKAPLAICAKQGFGGELIDGTCQSSQIISVNDDDPNCDSGEADENGDGLCDTNDIIYENTCEREQVCIDNQTCIKSSPDGAGCDEYGYCTKEQPIWRFAGDVCDSQYDSCQAYSTQNGELVSYLTDTTDSESCSVDNIGCQRYCYKDSVSGEFECYNTTLATFTGPQIYFDNDVERCNSTDEGCTEFYRTVTGKNIAPNSSFELYKNPFPVTSQATFDGWLVGDNDQTCGAQSFIDSVPSTGTYAMRLQRLPNACVPDAAHRAQVVIDVGSAQLDGVSYTVSFNARAINAPCNGQVEITNSTATTTFTPEYTSEFRRYSETINFPVGTAATTLTVNIEAPASCTLVLDDVKIEKGSTGTPHSQYGDDAITIKTPPPHLLCTGDSSDDPECANYTTRCDAQNVGCSSFAPADGGITIPGQVTDISQCDFANPAQCDQCPAAFVGCKAFNEEALSAKLPDPSHTERLSSGFVSVVPGSGRSCTAQYVGCEEYTNLNKISESGEALEYYSKVRQCVESDDGVFYFSWVGSQSNGFELKRWKLKESDVPGGAPCTNLEITSLPNALCEDTTNLVNDCTADFGSDPSCVEFFDDNGVAHYRYIEEIIFATDSCSGYRNTIDGNTYYFDTTNSTSCPAQYAGCREYKGAAANNTTTIINDDFESTSTPLNEWLNASISTESLSFPGHSMEVVGALVNKSVDLTQGKSYVIEFWAKADGPGDSLRVYFDTPSIPIPTASVDYLSWNGSNPNLAVSTEWQLYRLGPVELNWGQPTALIFNATSQVYVDNIQLRETTENLFIVKGSAASCDGFENCQKYVDQNADTHTLKGFSNLCKSSFVGCEALINTFNSDSPDAIQISSEQTYLNRQSGLTSNIVPEDTIEFIVNDATKYCSPEVQGCQELGRPTLNQDGSVNEWQSEYFRNDPDTFNTTLCAADAVGCSQYTEKEDGSLAFFKNPGLEVCKYRKGVGILGLTGWFKIGTDELCTDPWTRSCPEEQSTCREFYAPRVYDNPAAPDTQSYYYLASSVISNECTQGIDPNDSCIGFADKQIGSNTLRAKFDADNPDVVVSQSCFQCLSDVNTCGRDGNPPCCGWDPSTCSTDSAVGDDNVAPYYCVFNSDEAAFEQCQLSAVNSYAVPNGVAPTNCGAPGQPACFDMTGATATTSDDYLVANRYCGDFACTVNTVLKVRADRICAEWLECTNEETVIRDGRETTVCLERALVNKEGEYFESPEVNFEVSSPSSAKELANYSGLVRPGLLYTGNSSNDLLDGLFKYDAFSEKGLGGSHINVPDSNFESYKISVKNSPVLISESDPGTTWIDTNEFDWRPTSDVDGDTAILRIEKTGTSDNFSNQYLSIASKNVLENGARVKVDSGGEITEDAEYYMLSFKAKQQDVIASGIRMSLFQEGRGDVFFDANAGGITFTQQWEEYVVQLNNSDAADINYAGDDIELRFLHRDANTPGQTFYIDDVELKPVLHIQDAISGNAEPGLLGYYFQASLKPTLTSSSGLEGEYYNSALSLSVADWGVPNSTRTDSIISFDPSVPGSDPPNIGERFAEDRSVEWNGGILITDSTETTFYFNQNDSAQLFIEDMSIPLINKDTLNPGIGYSGKLKDVPAGWHPVRIRFSDGNAGGGLQFGWHPGLGGQDLGTSTDGVHYDWAAPPGTVIEANLDQALGAWRQEFPLCGLWSAALGPTGGQWQACLGGTVSSTSLCSSDSDCSGGGVCANFKMCAALGQPGSLVPMTNLTTELEMDMNNVFAHFIDSDIDLVVDFSDFDSRLIELTKRSDAVAVRWVGDVQATTAGSYDFHVTHKDGVRLFIDENLIIDEWNIVGGLSIEHSATVVLDEGWHAIKLEYYKDLDVNQDDAVVRLGWTPPGAPTSIYPIPTTSLRNFPPAPTGFVARNCRSYPQADSLLCDYTDPQSGVIYKGWKGYCVEKDPRDPNVCLNWWPIDVLTGETNIFSDQEESLTRAPLYYCAETRVKPAPMSIPRYICVSNFKKDDSNGMSHDRCSVVAIVGDLLPAGYDLDPSHWAYGSSSVNQGGGAYDCQLGSNQNTGVCCEVSQFNGYCTSSHLMEARTYDGDAVVINQAELDRCTDELEKYYGHILVKHFVDDGSRDDEACSGDNWGDDNTHCGDESGDDCFYTTVDEVPSFTCGFSSCTLEGSRYESSVQWYDDPLYPDNQVFPRQCTTLVQVTQKDGTSTPWTNKILNGSYDSHPTKYSLGTACAPFGALPVIDAPSDVLNCIPDPSDPPPLGCSTVTGECREVGYDPDTEPNPPGTCIKAPLEIYHPNNRDNNDISRICSETRLGAGFYSCGATGICQTCVGGNRNGLMCTSTSDCGTEGVCTQTYGQAETVGDTDHTFALVGQSVPLITPTTDNKSGIARLKQLFARSYGFWDWNDDAQKYVRKKDTFGKDFPNWSPPTDDGRPILDATETTVVNYGSVVSPVSGGLCNATDYHVTNPNLYCGIRPVISDIVVSGGVMNGTDVVLIGDNTVLSLEFDYKIDSEQSPLKEISIGWGDGGPISVYKSASAEKTYRFVLGVNGSCPGGAFPEAYTYNGTTVNACVYENYPRIKVRDNWDWCNIKSGSIVFGCSTNSSEWDHYNGRIVVMP